MGPGECSLDMTEELGLEQFFGNGSTIDRHQGLAGPATVVVKGLGDQFLTGAALAGDENGALGIRHLFDQGEH